MGAVHSGTLPRDLAPELRDGQLKLRLQVGGKLFEQDPQTVGLLRSIPWKKWPALSLAEMYELPDQDYAPVTE